MSRSLEEIDDGGGEEKDRTWIQIFSNVLSEVKEKELITPKETNVESK